MSDDFGGLSRDLADHLRAQGITALSPIQRATMPDLLAGRDVCAAAPTGSGKTLAFAAPLIERLGTGRPNRPAALVLSPTRELATQIHQVLADLGKVRGKWSTAVYGGMKQGPQVSNLRRGVDVLVACPGRLEDLIQQRLVSLADVRIVVIDEADRMADMGFLPAVRRILAQTAADRQTVLVSATLDKASDALARAHMREPVRHSVEPEIETTGNTTHLFWDVNIDDRTDVCAEVIKRSGRTIVFSRTKHGADRIAKRLERLGVRATAIHGGRSQSQRDRSLQAFHNGSATALIATDVAARGIHVDGVACVVHFDLPPASADYQHRSGRTARAGASGTVVSLVTPDVRKVARQLQRDHGLDFGLTTVDLDRLGKAVTDAESKAPAELARLGRSQGDAAHFERAEYVDERPAPRSQVRPEQRRGGPRGAAPHGHSSRRTRGAAPGPARQPRRAQPSR
jgi:superfamily II DNA/RNA helicase